MKSKVYSLFCDEVVEATNHVFATRTELDAVLISMMKQAIEQFEDPNDREREAIEEITMLLTALDGQQAATEKVIEAWQIFVDDEIKNCEDYYYIDEHEIELPMPTEALSVRNHSKDCTGAELPYTKSIPAIPGVDQLNVAEQGATVIAGPFYLDQIDTLVTTARNARDRAGEQRVFIAPQGMGFTLFKRREEAP